jgi:hypothetical protein
LTLGAKIRTPIPLSKLEIIHIIFFWKEINWEEKLSEVVIVDELWGSQLCADLRFETGFTEKEGDYTY